MIAKILILATVAVAHARHVIVDVEGASTASDRCPAQGHHLLPHEWDCTKFYYCEYGQKWVTPRDCAPGTEFSYEIQTCVHPDDANCQLSRVPPSSEESEESAETEAPTEAPTTTEAPIQSTEAATVGPVITTEAPILSTEAATVGPVITTEAPIQSTEAATVGPVITTEAPIQSTEAATVGPVITTEAPIQSTEAATVGPVITTEAPIPSTEAATVGPVITTEAPIQSTEAATVGPVITTEAPIPSTEAATVGPVITTEAPIQSTEAATVGPAITTEAATEATTEAATEAPELELLPNGCPVDFDVHQLLPHETRCDKFYYCVFGEKLVRDCPPNTAFNPDIQSSTLNWLKEPFEGRFCLLLFKYLKIQTTINNFPQVCDDPANVDCVNASESSEISDEGPGSSEITVESSEEDLEGSGEVDIEVEELLPNGCPADFDVHKLLPHESDCAKFYYCVFGETVVRECAPGTLFNAELEVCDRPENVVCANAVSDENESNESAENENNNESEGNSEESDGNSEESDILENGCPADFDIHQLLPHESDCTKFYYCVFGEKVERECDPNTHFNPTLQVCDWPQNAGCANAGSNENESTGSAENGNSEETSEETGASNENGSSEETKNSSEEATTTAAPETDATTPETDATTPETDATTSAPITLPTEAPEVELLPNGCPADFDVHQLLPHESDCAKFYYCVFGEKVERDCAPGTNFNPTLQVCDRPENAGCANADSGENESTGSAENGSNEENGNSNEDNENGNSNEDNENGNSNEDNENGNSNENNGSSGESDILPNGCPADFDVHTLLPHEYECGKFYYCVFGQKVERDCAPGTHFNPTLQVCDLPENVLCVGKAGSSVESSSEESSSEEVGPILPNGCPSDFDVHQLLPHESDCAKFYYCVFGEKVERDCAPGTNFSPTLQVCVMPEDAGCANAGSNENESAGSAENGNSQETSEESEASNENGSSEDANSSEEATTTAAPETDATTSAPITLPTDAPETEATTTAAPETDATTAAPITLPTEAPEIELLPNGCPADFNVHQLLPHESDCAKFYYCVFGDKVERDCAPGTHFNPTLQVCDNPENAGCANADSGENESTGSSENGNSDSNEDNGNSNDSNGNSEENNESSEESGILPNGCPADFDVHQLLPHEDNCAKFYYCVFGEKVERDCAPGTHFSAADQVCVRPEDAGCANADSGENESTGSSENGNSDSNEDNGNSNDSNGNSEENNESSEESGILPNGCPADFDVHQLLPHEDNCAKFYYCVFGEKVERDCAPGTHFNPTLQVCDRPENAGCANAGSEESGDSAENGSQESEGSGDSNENNSAESGSGDSAENGSQEASNENDSEENGSQEASNVSQESGASESAENGSQESDKCKTSCNVAAWAHEHDCDKFWRCDGENAVLGTCSEGLHFNVQTQTCDFICNAGCVRDDVQSTPEKEGLKLFLPWDKVDNTIRKLYLGQK
ncbi:uncharacterized protein LOC134676755 [Cydia fagiglandana]|uniref:uncharacterized protein LOC134676755 n=1 Tax=Cydia fagiglandana TaxID=1458189 RepID=UPI002FEE37BA